MIYEPEGYRATCENCLNELKADDYPDSRASFDKDSFNQLFEEQGWVSDADGDTFCCEECRDQYHEVEGDAE